MPMKNLSTKCDDGFVSFGNLSVTNALHASEISKYLSHPVENIKDLLKWWVDNQYVYPNLHHMALDYLSIPGTCII
jgi:hAT family C-terminal dimerisation region